MQNTILERINEVKDFLIYNKIIKNQQEFADLLGVDKGNISSLLKGKRTITDNFIVKISQAFPRIDNEWIKTGEGTMLKSDNKNTDTQNISDIKNYEEDNIKSRIFLFLAKNGIKTSHFERSVGLSNGYLNNFKGNMSIEKLEQILNSYPELSRDWLLRGTGSMLKGESVELSEPKQEEEYYTYLLPVSAEGGSLSGFADSVALRDCERIISPISGADFAISVHGDSMAPEYPNGSKVIIKRVNERAFIEWGKAYVLDTCNGVVIKKLMPSSKGEEYVSCVSVNPDYPPFDVCLEDVYRVYRVMLCMSVK